MIWHNAKLPQITQSGSLRYFKNPDLIKKLSVYYAKSDFITGLNFGGISYRDETIKLKNRILNNYYYSHYAAFKITEWLEIPESLMKARLPLQTNDLNLFNEFVNSFETRTRVLTMMINGNYDVALKRARN